jgi:ATP-dependent Clp protease ATP-binding subunit ClpB
LVSLLRQKDGVIPNIIKKSSVSFKDFLNDAESVLNKLPKIEGSAGEYLSPKIRVIANEATKLAEQLKDDYVSTEHLFLALSESKNNSLSPLFSKYQLDKDKILSSLHPDQSLDPFFPFLQV